MRNGWIRRELKIFWWRILFPPLLLVGGGFLLVGLLVSWLDRAQAERLRHRIPPEIPIAETVYYSSGQDPTCAVAVFALQEDFADRLRFEGASILAAHETPMTIVEEDGSEKAQGYSEWKSGPVVMSEMGLITRNVGFASLCLERDEYYSKIYENSVYGGGGYYAKNPSAMIAIIAPTEGLIFLAATP